MIRYEKGIVLIGRKEYYSKKVEIEVVSFNSHTLKYRCKVLFYNGERKYNDDLVTMDQIDIFRAFKLSIKSILTNL